MTIKEFMALLAKLPGDATLHLEGFVENTKITGIEINGDEIYGGEVWITFDVTDYDDFEVCVSELVDCQPRGPKAKAKARKPVADLPRPYPEHCPDCEGVYEDSGCPHNFHNCRNCTWKHGQRVRTCTVCAFIQYARRDR